MFTKSIAAVLLFLAALLCVRLSARQGQSTPGIGSGVAQVSGTVRVSELPPVTQGGTWRVAVDNMPRVTIANTTDVNVTNRPVVTVGRPEFVSPGQYAITWPNGEREIVTITNVDPSGWVRVGGSSKQRWVNVLVARSIEAM